MKKKLFITLLVLCVHTQFAQASAERELRIYKNIRCLVCQGQSIADSNSDFAQTIKLVVKDLIKDGKTENEIYSFMSDKYGEWIVFKPQINKQNFILWFLPYLALIFGGIIIFLILKRRRNL